MQKQKMSMQRKLELFQNPAHQKHLRKKLGAEKYSAYKKRMSMEMLKQKHGRR